MKVDDWKLPNPRPYIWKVWSFFFFRNEGIAFLFWPTRVQPLNGNLSGHEEGFRRPYTGWLEFVRYELAHTYDTDRFGFEIRECRVFRPWSDK
jgi:hypothetical protein